MKSKSAASQQGLQRARLDRRREEMRKEIVAATRALALEVGVSALTIDGVARSLGMTKQGLYYHFASREALLAAVCLDEWIELAREVNEKTMRAPSAADALEALMRTVFQRYAGRLELFRLVTQEMPASEAAKNLRPEDLEAYRPLNDLLYGPAEQKLRAEKRDDKIVDTVHPRRVAFLAHTSVMGILAMKILVESVNDPLIHKDKDLLDDLCRTFRASLTARS